MFAGTKKEDEVIFGKHMRRHRLTDGEYAIDYLIDSRWTSKHKTLEREYRELQLSNRLLSDSLIERASDLLTKQAN